MKPLMTSRISASETSIGKRNYYGQYILVAFLLISSLIFINSYAHFLEFNEKALGKYFPFKWILAGHIAGGATALLIGPLQFLKSFRNKFMSIHRIMGRIYLSAILISAVCALLLTFNTTSPIGIAYTISLQVLIFAWLFTSYFAFAAILKRQVLLHQQWMVRSYICTFAFVVQNYLLRIPILYELGAFAEIASTFIWFSWSVPLLIYQKITT